MWTAQELLATVPSYRNKPGDHFVYEDANYMLLGLVIEETTGMSVAAALRSHILADPRLSSLVYQVEERPKGSARTSVRRATRPEHRHGWRGLSAQQGRGECAEWVRRHGERFGRARAVGIPALRQASRCRRSLCAP